jgi:hypothetical protein
MCHIVRNAARCHECGGEVESRTRWDFVSCKCGSIFVDGGKEYLRRGGAGIDSYTDLSVFENCKSAQCRYREDVVTDDTTV